MRDNGKLVIGGDVTISTPGNDVVLDVSDNNFGSMTVSANNAEIVEKSDTKFGASTITGKLKLTSAGNVTQSGAVSVAGTVRIAAATKAVVLNNAANTFGQININAKDIYVAEADPIDAGSVTASGSLALISTGAITDSGPVSSKSTTTLTGTSIDFDTSSNTFGKFVLTSSGDVSIVEAAAVELGTTTVGGDLVIQASDAVTDSGKVDVSGTTTINAVAAAITLDDKTSVYDGAISLSGSTITLVNAQATVLGAITTLQNANSLGALTVTSTGAITNSDTLTIPGAAKFTALGQSVTLDNASNTFGSITLNSGNATVVENAATDLATSAVTATLSITSDGAITDSGKLTVAGTSTFNANGGASDVILDSSGNTFGTLVLTANNVSINEGGSAELGTSAINGTFTLKSAGAVTQSGALTVIGTTSITTASAITLADVKNTFANLSLSGGAVTVADSDATDLGVTKATTLSVSSGGAITDSGRITVAGATTLAASSGGFDVVFDVAGHNFGSLFLTAEDVVIVEDAALDLGTSNIAGDLTITAKGAITDSGTLSVSGLVTLTANGGEIKFDNSGSTFGTLVLSGTAITIVEAAATDLGTTTTAGNLTIISSGAVTDSGVLTAAGRLTVSASGHDITLDLANNFASVLLIGDDITLNEASATELAAITATGAFDLTSAGAVTDGGKIAATSTTITSPASVALDFTISVFGPLSISGTDILINNADGAGLNLGTTTATGTLNVTAKSVTDSGPLTAAGTTTFNTNTGDITLDQANSFGSLQLTGGAVTINEAGATDLGTAKITGAFTLTSGGAVTQSNSIAIGGALTVNSPGHPISLGINLNKIGGTVAFNGSDVVIADGSSLEVAASTATGSLTLAASGSVTDTGVLTVGTTTSITSSTGDIILDLANDFGSTLALSGKTVSISGIPSIALTTLSAKGNVSLATTGAVSLGPTSALGTLTISAGGSVTESGLLAIAGTVTIAAGSNDVLLSTTTGHSFGTLNISGQDVFISETGGTDLGTITATGDFTLTATGAVTDSGILTVTGATAISAGPNNVTLDKLSNYGTSLALGGNSVMVTSNAPINLGTSTIAGYLTIVTTGAITDAGAISVGGATTITAGAANDITLDSASNAFASLKVVSANNVTVTDLGGLDLAEITTAGNLDVSSSGPINDIGKLTISGTTKLDAPGQNVTIDGTTSKFAGAIAITGSNVTFNNLLATNLAGINATGNVAITSTGAIIDTGTIAVGGSTAMKALGVDIALDDAGNALVGPVSFTGKNVSLTNHVATQLGASSVAGAFTVISSNNAISTVSSLLNVTGATSLDAGTGDVTLSLVGAKLSSTLSLIGDDITITGNTAFKLASVTATGDFSLTTNGTIEDSGKIAIGGTASLQGGTTGGVVLDFASNEFEGALSLGGTLATIVNTKATTLAAATLKGALNLTSGGAVTDTGTLSVTGIATITATGQNITLDVTTSKFGSLALNGADVSITTGSALDLGTSNITGNLSLSVAGTLTDSGKVAVTGSTTILATNFGSIVLDNLLSTFVGTVSMNAQEITLKSATDLVFGTTTSAGNMTIVVSGGNDITDVGIVTVLGNVSMNAGTGIIDLDGAVFAGTIQLSAAKVNYV